ncbi:MAG: bifunctional enoyl-CoA hydratase/phosphate acetyltransferase [Candidatus Delongbacteria bacterium]|nr:bifunctional enoyl-CoA hydratase/phosphate acetyltransferase [Candidatus Delongbacteria bacterium]MBN2836209.1 bifunctional enoyl-CoA hydratase/phosphate acetyltransferase [Candidatus Delongbacteria bacterium]
MLKSLADLDILLEKQTSKKRLVLAAAEDDNALEAVFNAKNVGVIEPILVGDEEKIRKIASDKGFDLTGIELLNVTNPNKAAEEAVKLVNSKKADILMKGHVSTSGLLKAVLNKEFGLRSGSLLSHLALFEVPTYHKVIGLTDAAMNIAPDLKEKEGIIRNSVEFMNKLGYEKPKVAIIAAVEAVNPAMPATLDAAIFAKMSDRKQIPNCIIDGPLAFDNAVSHHSAEHKGIVSPVAGEADLLMAPDIEAANVMYKSFIYFANAKAAAVILGAKSPIVLTSRADSDEIKLTSIKLAAAI